MLSRLQRPWLLGAVLAALALLPARESCRAQATGAATGTVQKPDAAARKRESASPPFPGQLTNSTAGKGADERHKRIPPILIAFVLLFLITWVRAYLERRRLRASFRQSCEFPPQ